MDRLVAAEAAGVLRRFLYATINVSIRKPTYFIAENAAHVVLMESVVLPVSASPLARRKRQRSVMADVSISRAIRCIAEAAENAVLRDSPARAGVVIAQASELFAMDAASIPKPAAFIAAHAVASAQRGTPAKRADASSFALLLSPTCAESSVSTFKAIAAIAGLVTRLVLTTNVANKEAASAPLHKLNAAENASTPRPISNIAELAAKNAQAVSVAWRVFVGQIAL